MPNALDKDAILYQNLIDAGCSDEEALAYMDMISDGDLKTALKSLADRRKMLLDTVHDDQHRIDCLDYLVFQLKK